MKEIIQMILEGLPKLGRLRIRPEVAIILTHTILFLILLVILLILRITK